MMGVFAAVRTTIALGDVRRNRHGGTADLARQAVGLFTRKVLGKSIRVKRQLDTLLPNNELPLV